MVDFLRTVKISTRELWSDGRGWILVTVAAGWFLSIGMRFVYPTLVPFFGPEFRMDFATTGLLLTMLWGAYALGHVPGGIIGDRIGEGNVLVLSTVISASTVLVIAGSVNVWMMFVGTIAFGVATALYGPTRITIFTDIYPTRAGSAIGLTMAAGSIGNTILPVLSVFVATYVTWRMGFGLFLPLFVTVAVVLWIAVPEQTSARTSTDDVFSVRAVERVLDGIATESIPVVVSVQVCLSFIMQGFSSFYPTYLTVTKELSPEGAATLFGLFFAVGAVIQPLSGSSMDRFGARKTLVGFFGGSVLGLWAIPFVDGRVQLAGVTVLFSSINGCLVVTQTYIADSLPEEVQGTGLGTLKASWILLGATSPLLVGLLADSGYFDEAFLVLAGVATIGLSISLTRL